MLGHLSVYLPLLQQSAFSERETEKNNENFKKLKGTAERVKYFKAVCRLFKDTVLEAQY